MSRIININTSKTVSVDDKNFSVISIPCNVGNYINEETVYKITKADEEVV